MTERYTGKFDFTVKTSSEAVHTMRELTLLGLDIHNVTEPMARAAASVSEHYHALALALEKKFRAERGTQFVSAGVGDLQMARSADEEDQMSISVASVEFQKQVANELHFITQNKGWTGDKLPKACDSAIRKIVNAWKDGASLLVLDTVSKCQSHVAAAGKEKAEAEHAAIMDNQSADNSAIPMTGIPEVDAELLRILAAAKVVANRDSKTAVSSLQGYANKITGMAERLAGALKAA